MSFLSQAKWAIGTVIPCLRRIRIQSVELVCFHEAGHLLTAFLSGALVAECELYLDTPPYARSRIGANPTQRRVVSCGGYAAEYLLFKSGLLVDLKNNKLTEAEFTYEAIENSRADKVQFFGRDLSVNGIWPSLMNQEFFQAGEHLSRGYNISALRYFADALKAKRFLTDRELTALYKKAKTKLN